MNESPATARRVDLEYEINGSIVPESFWMNEFNKLDRAISRGYRWDTEDGALLEPLMEFDPFAAQIDIFGRGSLAAWWDGALLFMLVQASSVFIRGAGDLHAVERAVERVRELYPESVTLDDEIVIQFWMDEPRLHPSSQSKKLRSPTWEESQINYSRQTRDSLARVMRGFRPSDSGQLFLWHGEPGTGKTWAIQTLAREWKSWCRVDCITDPEAFLGSASYMHHVLLDEEFGRADRWRLIVLEDTGELLSSDAKMRTGQGLSRLLNLTDGLLGRGSRALVLITSNENLETFHPAVSRAGRCASNVKFEPLGANEAREWLRVNGGSEEMATSAVSLADLYATARGQSHSMVRPVQVGFRAARNRRSA